MLYLVCVGQPLQGKEIEYRSTSTAPDARPHVIVKAIEEAIGKWAGTDTREGQGKAAKLATIKKNVGNEPARIAAESSDTDPGEYDQDTNFQNPADLLKSAKKNIDSIKSEHQATATEWRKEYYATLAGWAKEREDFLKDLPMYKANLVEIPSNTKDAKRVFVPKKKALDLSATSKVVSSAFDLPVKDQGNRGTCAAFAAIRALEILLKQNGRDETLSEQYFYWASRSTCQTTPCSNAGSWVAEGFEYSKGKADLDIPMASFCPYNRDRMDNNDTQIPLKSQCFGQGAVKLVEFSKVSNTQDMKAAIAMDVPVIAAFSLSKNFYINKGVISLEDPVDGRVTDLHAAGHAVLVVGMMNLPKKFHATEGTVCFIIANSWGLGWGLGGHSCITESWAKRHKLDVSFIAVKNAQI